MLEAGKHELGLLLHHAVGPSTANHANTFEVGEGAPNRLAHGFLNLSSGLWRSLTPSDRHGFGHRPSQIPARASLWGTSVMHQRKTIVRIKSGEQAPEVFRGNC